MTGMVVGIILWIGATVTMVIDFRTQVAMSASVRMPLHCLCQPVCSETTHLTNNHCCVGLVRETGQMARVASSR